MQISANTVVHIHYTLKNDGGDILDSSEGMEPLAYLHGAGNILPKLEQALEGRGVGDKINVSLAPADGYGERQPELIQEVPRNLFPLDEIEPGMQFSSEGPHGGQVLTVTAVTTDSVTVDANHPLAGETLHFDVEVMELRAATLTEIAHGHIHHGGDHDHH
jgi:FKBP-type peptidyl-prolyl cis-trans isomerase SlyD